LSGLQLPRSFHQMAPPVQSEGWTRVVELHVCRIVSLRCPLNLSHSSTSIVASAYRCVYACQTPSRNCCVTSPSLAASYRRIRVRILHWLQKQFGSSPLASRTTRDYGLLQRINGRKEVNAACLLGRQVPVDDVTPCSGLRFIFAERSVERIPSNDVR